ncbi:MAG: SPW repeat protein [Parcubacteria group bacterium]|jgi:hypothetical protein
MDNTTVKTASGINIVAGIWLIIAPFLLGFTGALRTSDIVFGIIIAILALIRVSAPEEAPWVSWINMIFGIWILLSPFFLGYIGVAALWNNIILGVIVAVLAAWSASSSTIQRPMSA